MDAPCKIQRSIHVCSLLINQCVQDSGYISPRMAFFICGACRIGAKSNGVTSKYIQFYLRKIYSTSYCLRAVIVLYCILIGCIHEKIYKIHKKGYTHKGGNRQ